MMTYKQWLAEHGKESCSGCRYNNARRARCNYRGRECARYVQYKKEQQGEQLTIF